MCVADTMLLLAPIEPFWNSLPSFASTAGPPGTPPTVPGTIAATAETGGCGAPGVSAGCAVAAFGALDIFRFRFVPRLALTLETVAATVPPIVPLSEPGELGGESFSCGTTISEDEGGVAITVAVLLLLWPMLDVCGASALLLLLVSASDDIIGFVGCAS